MATFLDVTSLRHFNSLFVFLFAWIFVYAMLMYFKVLGGNNFVAATLGLLLAIFVVTNEFAAQLIGGVAPIIVAILVLIVFFSITGRMLGADVEHYGPIKAVMLVIIVMIIMVSIGFKVKDSIGVDNVDRTDLSKSVNLLFHPSFLGSMLILLVSIFTVALLATKSA
ncbi:MAG: hypothetical protein AABX00_07045 [Nanoarchaeota archaeon]